VGSQNKVFLGTAVQTDDAQAVLACLSPRPFTKEALADFRGQSLVLLTLIFDGLGCFTAVARLGVVHECTVTGGGAASAWTPRAPTVPNWNKQAMRENPTWAAGVCIPTICG